MSYQTIKQPDEKLAVWSTVIDDFIQQDLTPEGVEKFYAEGDRFSCDLNRKYAWSTLTEERREEEARKFMAEATAGILEQAIRVQNGQPREGDWTWDEAIEIVRSCHGLRRYKEVLR